jgi:hypothetical protein
MNEKSFSAWLQDVTEETAKSDGEPIASCQSYGYLGMAGSGFVIRMADGEEFQVSVYQTARMR